MQNTASGLIIVNTGDGKGKTTAAFGLALRAAGAGLKVFIAQFTKGREYSELKALDRFREEITVRQYGRSGFIEDGKPEEEDIDCAREGLIEVKCIIQNGKYPLVILDLFYPLIQIQVKFFLLYQIPVWVLIE